ncbi:MAG: hypothetical protein FWG56_06190 [Desulfovibrionaceae bacterium]|nr:hypothetical protein [Desulfovibrionaceae bacterium]
MADNYYDATGVLILERVTPVITALFGVFNLDESYPGNGQAYIARVSGEGSRSWDSVLDGLIDLAAKLGLAAPGADKTDGDAGGEPPIVAVLTRLAEHFGADQNEELENLIEHHQFEDDADLEALFLIASCFNDGHNLVAIEFEGCWYCSKPRLFEFGGEGSFLSREIQVFSQSSTARFIGQELRNAIVADDPDAAAELIAKETRRLLAGITDERWRMRVFQHVITRLSEKPSIGDAD